MKTQLMVLFGMAVCSWPAFSVAAQDANQNSTQPGQATAQENRQENRQQRRDERQERREDRQAQRTDRQQQRENSRASYYDEQALSQLDPIGQRNNISPLERVSRAANAAVRVTERALNTAANAADAATNAAQPERFGYDNPNATGESAWFYDHYSYSPTYYGSADAESKVYSAARQYYDLDNDGVYESLNVFRDTNQDASFDAFDRFDFAAVEPSAADANQTTPGDDLPADARRHTVTGQLYASKSVRANGVEHLVVRLSNVQDETAISIIDLGPLAAWKDQSYKAGDQLSARGPVQQVGQKQILIAESAKLGGNREVSIDRAAPKVTGQVVEVTESQVRGTQHTLAVIDSDSTRQIVDLGPSAQLKVKVQPQSQLTVRGIRVRAGNYSVLQADHLELDGQKIDIQR